MSLEYHLHLEELPFSATYPSEDLPLFFDEHHRVCISLDDTEVVVNAPDGGIRRFALSLHHRKNQVASLRFSPDFRQLAVLYRGDYGSLTLIDTSSGRLRQLLCRSKAHNGIKGFFYVSDAVLLLVTRRGVEAHDALRGRLLKELTVDSLWFHYYPPAKLLFLASGDRASHVQWLRCKADGGWDKMPRFELEARDGGGREVRRADVLVCCLYGRLFLLQSPGGGKGARRVVLYHLGRESVGVSARLHLHLGGAVVLQVVDNLVVVHHMEAKISMIYDVRSEDPVNPVVAPLPLAPLAPEEGDAMEPEQDGLLYSKRWKPYPPNLLLVFRRPRVRLFRLRLHLPALALSLSDPLAVIRFLLRRKRAKPLLLERVRALIGEQASLDRVAEVFDVLNNALLMAVQGGWKPSARRDVDAKDAIGQALVDAQAAPPPPPPEAEAAEKVPPPPQGKRVAAAAGYVPTTALGKFILDRKREYSGGGPQVESAFRPLAEGEKRLGAAAAQGSEVKSQHGGSATAVAPAAAGVGSGISASGGGGGGGGSRMIQLGGDPVDQIDMYRSVFDALLEAPGVSHRYLYGVILEYVRSLHYRNMVVDHDLYKMLIGLLVRTGHYFQLHQLLQFHVISDSVQVACQLLSMGEAYPPSFQLALDMLKRLGEDENIVEILLARREFTALVKFLQKREKRVAYSAARILQTVADAEDRMAFYNLYVFFDARGDIASDPNCAPFIQLFNDTFVLRKGLTPPPPVPIDNHRPVYSSES